MSELVLTGLDGSNPLGFLAALGAVNAVTRDGSADAMPLRLVWRDLGYWRPVLVGVASREELVHRLLEDANEWKQEPVIQLTYGDGERDLKPPPGEYRRFLAGLVTKAKATRRRSVDFAAAFATDVATDNAGKTKPTALHFTAGQMKFLAQVIGLLEGVNQEDLEETLFGPWQYTRALPVLKWDATITRDYALRAGDPSKEKALGVPGADWLAFRGLSFLPAVPRGRDIHTTGCFGGWKTGGFRWPLWSVPLSRDAIRTALCLGAGELLAHERAARGIPVVFESRIRRSDQGGYGSFTPAAVI